MDVLSRRNVRQKSKRYPGLRALQYAGTVVALLCVLTTTLRAQELTQTVIATIDVSENGELMDYQIGPGASYLIKPTFDRFVRYYNYSIPRDAKGDAVASPGKLMAVYRFVANEDGTFNVYLDDQKLWYRPDRGDAEPLLKKRKNPFYPHRALDNNIEGWVLSQFTIDKKGRVRNIEILGESPPDAFSASARSALKKWRFEPVVIDGKPTEVQDTQIFEFFLEDPQ